MTARTRWTLALFAIVQAGLFGQAVAGQLVEPGLVIRVLKLDVSQFDEETLVQASKKQLAGVSGGFLQARIEVVGKGAALPKPTHTSFDGWQQMWKLVSDEGHPSAELIAIRGAAALRARDKNGKLFLTVLSGANPLALAFHDRHYEMVHIAIGSADSPFRTARADIYVVANQDPSDADGVQILRSFQALLPSREIHVYVRRDPLFVFQPSYPFKNPFADYGIIPSRDQYQGSRTLHCSQFVEGDPCTRY